MALVKDKIQQQKKEEEAYKFFLSSGWKPHQASAIVGNIKRESNFDTSVLGTADTKGSRGLVQWHSGRLDTLKKKYGSNWTDFRNQLEFVNWELNNTHKSAGDALRQTKGVWDAGKVVTDKYEIPKVKWDRDEKRQTYVTDNYKKYSGIQLTPEDQASFLKGTAQRAIDNYEASYLPNIVIATPQISNLESYLPLPTLAEDNTQVVAQENEAVLKAKMELQQKQNEENLFNDLLKASQLQYVDPNQAQDYTQTDQEQQFQDGGVKQKYEDWYKTVPEQKRDTIHYDLRRAYELAPADQLEAFVKDPQAHLYSVYENTTTGNYDFMKDKNHPTIKNELDWYYSSDPEAIEFRKKYKLTDKGNRYEYTKQFQEGGSIPVSSNGVWEVGRQNVIVPTDGNITMKPNPMTGEPIDYNILAISKETGEQKMLYPEQNYFFKNTQNVLEIPQLKQQAQKNKNKRFL